MHGVVTAVTGQKHGREGGGAPEDPGGPLFYLYRQMVTVHLPHR